MKKTLVLSLGATSLLLVGGLHVFQTKQQATSSQAIQALSKVDEAEMTISSAQLEVQKVGNEKVGYIALSPNWVDNTLEVDGNISPNIKQWQDTTTGTVLTLAGFEAKTLASQIKIGKNQDVADAILHDQIKHYIHETDQTAHIVADIYNDRLRDSAQMTLKLNQGKVLSMVAFEAESPEQFYLLKVKAADIKQVDKTLTAALESWTAQ